MHPYRTPDAPETRQDPFLARLLQKRGAQTSAGVLVMILVLSVLEGLGVGLVKLTMPGQLRTVDWVLAPIAGICVIFFTVIAGVFLRFLYIAAQDIGADIAKRLNGEE